MKGMTVAKLLQCCKEQVEKGNGKKRVLISTDDEGNGFHTLYWEFIDDPDQLLDLSRCGMFHDNDDPNEIVLLG